MSRGRVHIVNVSIPGLPLAVAASLMQGGGLAAAMLDVGTSPLDVIIEFGDGSRYLYPDVPAPLALAVKQDPESGFQNIKFWPGYHKI